MYVAVPAWPLKFIWNWPSGADAAACSVTCVPPADTVIGKTDVVVTPAGRSLKENEGVAVVLVTTAVTVTVVDEPGANVAEGGFILRLNEGCGGGGGGGPNPEPPEPPPAQPANHAVTKMAKAETARRIWHRVPRQQDKDTVRCSAGFSGE